MCIFVNVVTDHVHVQSVNIVTDHVQVQSVNIVTDHIHVQSVNHKNPTKYLQTVELQLCTFNICGPRAKVQVEQLWNINRKCQSLCK